MKKITRKEVKKLTVPQRFGRVPRAPALYKELKKMKVGETRFMERKEWIKTGYKVKTFKAWWTVVRNQRKEKHVSSLSGIELIVTTYVEGWTVEKIKD